jgi:hypothetical protein
MPLYAALMNDLTVLTDLRLRSLFKVAQPSEFDGGQLTVDSVYAVTTKRAEYGKSIVVADLATVRQIRGGGYRYSVIKVPTEKARTVKVYKIPLFSN